MLSDIDITNLIRPFESRQQKLEQEVIKIIAQRVNQIGTMSKSDLHKLERLYETGSDVRKINQAIAVATNLQVKDIKKLIKYVALDAYIDVKPYYDYRHRPYIPFEQNTPLQRVVAAISRQTQGTFKNLSNSKALGFVIRDRKNPKKKRFYNAAETYQTVVDEAIQAVQGGVTDYNSAMRRTMKQLGEGGMKTMYWESGYKQATESTVKRNILDGIKQIVNSAREILGEQFGADGYEITAHRFPAPDHAPFQGHVLSVRQYKRLQDNKSFKDIKGNRFPAQERILGQYNCRHLVFPVITTDVVPTFTDEQLQALLDENEKGITLSDGRHLTGYEATQEQNRLARNVRRAKEKQMMAEEEGDEELVKEYRAEVNKATKQFNAFNKTLHEQFPDMSTRKDKLTVNGYRRTSSK